MMTPEKGQMNCGGSGHSTAAETAHCFGPAGAADEERSSSAGGDDEEEEEVVVVAVVVDEAEGVYKNPPLAGIFRSSHVTPLDS